MLTKTIDGAKLRETREEHGLTGYALAALTAEQLRRPVHPSTVYQLESGRRQPSAPLFGALCRALQCPAGTLLVEDTKAERAA